MKTKSGLLAAFCFNFTAPVAAQDPSPAPPALEMPADAAVVEAQQ